MDDPKEIGLSKQAINIYRKTLCNDVSNEEDNKLQSRVYHLLFWMSVSKRHSEMAMEIIESSVKTLENFDALNAAKAFRILETFAKNLIKYPWKKGYKRLKLYSGVIKLKLDRWLKGSKTIFEALGYREKTRNEFVLLENINHDICETIALECYIAAVEMEIYKDIYDKVYNHGYTYEDVHRCRLHCNEDTKGCELWIKQHCVPYRKETRPYHSANMKSFNETPDFNTNGFKPRNHNDMPISTSKQSVVSPKQKADSIGGQPGMEPATIDDHLKESERLLQIGKEQQLPLPKVPPPSYQSMYSSSGQQYDQEWGDVRLKLQELGDKFTDPGGRGDILRGDNMVPVEVKIPPVTTIAVNCSVEKKPLYSIIRDTRVDIPVTDGPDSLEDQPQENLVRNALLSNLKNTKAESNRDHAAPFSTFGRSPEGKQSPLSPEIATIKRPDQVSVTKHNYDGDNDVYVSLRETRSPPLREGKPSFQDNFQKTTQRFYQADSYQSLPYVGGKSARSSGHSLSRNNKTTPVTRDKVFMRSTSEDMWQCEKCTLANNKNESVCKICGTSREKRPEKPLKSGGNVCLKCTYVNDAGSVECKVCQNNLQNSPTYI